MSKYLYEKSYISGHDKVLEMKIFSSSKDLFEYMLKLGEVNFNAGFSSAEITLNRVEKL